MMNDDSYSGKVIPKAPFLDAEGLLTVRFSSSMEISVSLQLALPLLKRVALRRHHARDADEQSDMWVP